MQRGMALREAPCPILFGPPTNGKLLVPFCFSCFYAPANQQYKPSA